MWGIIWGLTHQCSGLPQLCACGTDTLWCGGSKLAQLCAKQVSYPLCRIS